MTPDPKRLDIMRDVIGFAGVAVILTTLWTIHPKLAAVGAGVLLIVLAYIWPD